ncbi:hypothetical protein GCM10009839_85080 [Catenulispora yoronensis]|uniref:Uncharacterized protein n=1 Tax=Catenulispora yoronensis TaxID=450799 RepID=A0ABP5H6C3_9ACTN
MAVPPILILRLRSSRELRLRWNDPARIIEIRMLSEGYAFPTLAAFAITPPRLPDHPRLRTSPPHMYPRLLALGLLVGAGTQFTVYAIVRHRRTAILNILAAAPGLPYGTALVVQYVAAVVGSVVGFLLQ